MTFASSPQVRFRVRMLAGLAIAAFGAGFFAPPIPQDGAYHDFADARGFLGIPSFWNVVSNLPFLAIGLAGLLHLRKQGNRDYAAFFASLVLTAFGSAYYHVAPDDGRLFWDRLPMALSFTAILAAVLGDRLGPSTGRTLILVAAGAAGAVHWRLTGDLSFYILAQYASILGVLLAIALLPARHTRTTDLLLAVAVYAVGKAFEMLDVAVYAWGGLLSGHTVKHLVSAAAAAILLRMLRLRAPRENRLSPAPAEGYTPLS